MSKILAGTAFVLLGGATATGGVLLLKGGSKGAKDKGDKQKEKIDAELQKDLSTFKNEGKGKGCVKSLFPNLESIGTEEDSANIDQNFLTSGTDTKGCLVVNWDKYTKTEGTTNKWRGNFRFLWAVQGGNKGFIVFLSGKTPTTENKQEIQWEGGIYKLEESTGDTKKWTAKKQQELATTPQKVFKKETGEDASKKFPQPGTALKTSNDSTDVPSFWGLLANLDDLTKIDTSTAEGASQTPNSSLRAYWSWKSQTGTNKKKLSDWSKDWDKWWKEVFEETKFKAKELTDAHQGDWTREKYDVNPKVGGSAGG